MALPISKKFTLLFAVVVGMGNVQAETPGQRPIPVKVVVVTMFEIGADAGDRAAEFQLWKEREKLNQKFAFPQGYHDLYTNDQGVLGIVTGMGIANAAASIMALGLDPRFDLTEAYWLVAGIAGIDPADGSIGSAAWAGYLVDGDLAHEIDAREIPADWPNGYFARGTSRPGIKPEKPDDTSSYTLNLKLQDWAYRLTKDIVLPDSEGLKRSRERYTETPEARRPPFVLKGDHLAASTFWHGKLLNAWANQWVKLWTDNQANYVTTAMEDTATLQSLTYLQRAGKVDLNRVMVLRTASNFDSPPPGITAAENMAAEGDHQYSGFAESIEAAHLVGSKVVHEIVKNWSKYENEIPH